MGGTVYAHDVLLPQCVINPKKIIHHQFFPVNIGSVLIVGLHCVIGPALINDFFRKTVMITVLPAFRFQQRQICGTEGAELMPHIGSVKDSIRETGFD